MPEAPRIPLDQMTLDELEHARYVTQAILTQHMGANVETDRQIVERAHIRLGQLNYAIAVRKKELALGHPPSRLEGEITGSRLHQGARQATPDATPPGALSSEDRVTPVEPEKLAGWKVGKIGDRW